MNRRYAIALSLLAVIVGGTALAINASGILNGDQNKVAEQIITVSSPQGMTLDGWVTVKWTKHDTGEVVILKDNEHNVLMDLGANATRDYLLKGFATAGPAFDWIAIGNSTTPNRTAVYLNLEISDCGFDRAQGTFTNAGPGNSTLTKTFTSTCSGMIVNTTGTFNHTTLNTGYFAGANFTNAAVQSADTVAVTWMFNITGNTP